MPHPALPRRQRCALALLALCASAASPAQVTVTFRNGQSPTAGYAGTVDTCVDYYGNGDYWDPNGNYSARPALNLDGDPSKASTLIKFDLAAGAIPASAIVTGVNLVFWVTNSGETYNVYESQRPWTSAANWNTYDGTNPWTMAGAQSTTGDRSATVLGSTVSGTPSYQMTIPLDPSAVQAWVSGARSNNGFIIQNYANTDGIDMTSSEGATGSHRPMLVVSYTDASVSYQASFQQGVLPTTAYAGAVDTVIGNGPAPTCDTLGLGAGPKVSTLLKFDISAIPTWATIQSANFTFRVTNSTAQTYQYSRLLQAWDQAAASWTNRTSTATWAGAGVTGAADHGASLGGFTAASGTVSVPISASGVGVLNTWVATPSSNNGFLIQNYANNDGLSFDDSEDGTIAYRPGLTVTYYEGKLVFTSSAQTAATGATSAAITVQRQTLAGVALNPSAALVVNLSSTSALGQFSTSSGGPWSSTLALTIASGQSTGTFYYRDGNTGASTITAAAGSAWQSTTQGFTTLPDVFADDFETNALLPPTGRWTDIWAPVAANSISTSTAAWHRGSYGALFVDADSGTTNNEEGEVEYSHASIQPAYYARTWMQIFSTNRSGAVEFFLVSANNANTLYSTGFVYASGSATLYAGGYDSAPTPAWIDDTGSVPYTAGSWHLLEMAITGLGTTSGTRKLYVDGTLATSATNVDFSAAGFGAATLMIGEPWSDSPSFAGNLYFDDVRVSTAPQASKLALAVPGGPVNVNTCQTITASLRDSLTGSLAPAPYGVIAGLSVTGVTGAFYSNPTCTTSTTTVSIAAGGSSAIAYFKPTAAGTATLSISHPDFLSPTPAPTLTVVSGSPLAISPISTTVSAGTSVQFTASGGSGAGYSFSISTNNSGATWLNQSTGLYKAGPTSGVTDTVQVMDSLGTIASATVTVLNLLTISPTSASVGAGGLQTFTASGGVAPYTFSMAANPSGGLVTTGGAYTAGSVVGVIDQVRVTDGASSTATATVSVTPSSTLRVRITGPASFTVGVGSSYALQVVDGAGNTYAATKSIQANLRPVPSGPAISAIFNASSIGPTGGATTSGNTSSSGSATAGVQDVVAEAFQLCATVDGTEQCTVVTANPGPANNARAQLQGGGGTVPACSTPTLSLALVDAYGNVVPAAAAFTLCAGGGGGTITSTTLQGPVPSGLCVSGQLPAGGATATVSSLSGGTTTFTPSSPSAPGPAIAAQLTWAAPALSLQDSVLEIVNAQSPADLPTGGGHLTARIAPRDSCGNGVSLPSSQVFLEAPEPLAVGPAVSDPQDSTAYLYDLSLSACPADPTSLLLVPARLSGEPLVDSGGAFRALAIRAVCRPARFVSQGNTAAQCRLPYRYSDTGVPSVSGDGPFAFHIAGNGAAVPDGLTLSPAGEIFWVPTPEQAGLHSLNLTVAGAAGQDTQRLDIQVSCSDGPSFRFCGCSSGEGIAAAGIWLLCAAALRRGRRRQARPRMVA